MWLSQGSLWVLVRRKGVGLKASWSIFVHSCLLWLKYYAHHLQSIHSATKDNENCDPWHLLKTRLGKLEVELGFGDLEANPFLPVCLNAFHLSPLQDINNSHLSRIVEKPRVISKPGRRILPSPKEADSQALGELHNQKVDYTQWSKCKWILAGFHLCCPLRLCCGTMIA